MLAHSPSLVLPGLVLCLDAANRKSYPTTGTTWTDLSGLGNTGTLVNGVGYNASNGGSLSFDGVNDYTLLGNISQLQFERTDSFSCSCFAINKDINAVALSIIGNSQTANAYKGWTFNFFNRTALKANSIALALYSNVTTSNLLEVQTAQNSITANLWYHVAFTYTGNSNSSGVNLYINAVNQLTTVSTNSLTASIKGTENLYIGSRGAVGQYLNGNISSLQVYNRALSAAEISQNYNATKSRYGLT